MTLSSFLYSKRQIALKLKDAPKSPARTALIKLLKLPNRDLIEAVADAWFYSHYGIKPFGTNLTVPKSIIPSVTNPDEFFQIITDHLKKSIGK